MKCLFVCRVFSRMFACPVDAVNAVNGLYVSLESTPDNATFCLSNTVIEELMNTNE